MLIDQQQSKQRVSDYAIDSRTLSADSGWNSSTFFDAYLHGLSQAIKLIAIELHKEIDSDHSDN